MNEEVQRDITHIKELLSNNLLDTSDTLKALLDLKEKRNNQALNNNQTLNLVILRVREAELHLQLANSHMKTFGGE